MRYLTRPSFLPAICWLILVTVLLVLPGSAFPQENWLSRIWFDKWVHIGLFAVMTLLGCRGWLGGKTVKEKRKQLFLYTALAALVYGIIMEFVQKYLVVNRSFDIGDILADGAGSLTGWFISYRRYIKK